MVLLSMQKDDFWSLVLVDPWSQYPVGLGQNIQILWISSDAGFQGAMESRHTILFLLHL